MKLKNGVLFVAVITCATLTSWHSFASQDVNPVLTKYQNCVLELSNMSQFSIANALHQDGTISAKVGRLSLAAVESCHTERDNLKKALLTDGNSPDLTEKKLSQIDEVLRIGVAEKMAQIYSAALHKDNVSK